MGMNFSLVSFSIEHKSELLKSFESNVPDYFDPSEKIQFSNFLDNINNKYKKVNYYTIYGKNKIIGAGGFAIIGKNEARLVWLLVSEPFQQNKAGKFIMEAIQNKINSEPGIKRIGLQTSQHIVGFFEKFSFLSIEEQKDFWGKGLHLIVMEKQL
jgi:predicted GNAT family N-acyltransferase